MAILLYLASILIFGVAALFFAGAKSAIHEILAAVMFLTSAVCFTGAAIVQAVNRVADKQDRAEEK